MPVQLKVLFTVAEVFPLVKTGGLADVAAGLPEALKERGVDVRILLPGYRSVVSLLRTRPVGKPFKPLLSADRVRLLRSELPGRGIPIYLIDAPALYDRPGGPYSDHYGKDWWDNAIRFGVLSKVGALFGSGAGLDGWKADVLHMHDWHAGLASAYTHFDPRATAATVYTVHNLAYQGNFDRKVRKALGISSLAFHMDGLEFHGNLSFMKAGLYYSDQITTVSPTYARQIQTREHGCGMDGVIRKRSDRLTGILNGIDEQTWNPDRDPHLPARFNADSLAGKAKCKAVLEERTGLTPDPQGPIAVMMARMTAQKGWDLFVAAAPALLAEGLRLVAVGGEGPWQAALDRLAAQYPGRFAVVEAFSEEMAHLAEAGADLFLMPSLFEPGGLTQLYSQRYGTPPVVHRTGGLADSVTQATEANIKNGTGTGFLFNAPTSAALAAAVRTALDLYRNHPAQWIELRRNAMRKNSGWGAPAERYLGVYESAIDHRRAAAQAYG
jgi:starch synthase